MVTIGALVALTAAGCGDNVSATNTTATAPAAPDGPLRLEGVCPDTVVLQTDWAPEAEHGGIYQLLGQHPTVDAEHKRLTGTLVSQGQDTGVKLEIRAGGPAIGYQTVSAQMYADPSITLGQVGTDEAVRLATTQPTTAVVAPLDISPQMIMWDPAGQPGWRTIADIGRTDTKVLYFQAASYMEYLIGAGILHRGQVDGSYDGSPATFVAAGGKIAQQGFATNEPYLYESALPQWHKPVRFQLINDTGYTAYPESLAVRSGQKAALAPCLRKLAPIVQRAEVDYLKAPVGTNALIAGLVPQYNMGVSYTAAQAAFSTEQQLTLHIAGNAPGTSTLGGFDRARVQHTIDILRPIVGDQLKAGLTPDDVATTEFIDPAIGLTP